MAGVDAVNRSGMNHGVGRKPLYDERIITLLPIVYTC
jgi:hypothetical protein